MANTNCLEGFKCPKCGSDKEFFIECSQVMRVDDNGTYGEGDVEWYADSRCSCANDACEYTATVKEFRP